MLKNHQTTTYYLSQQIHCNNGAFSFSNKTSPDEFVSRPICAIPLRIPTVLHEKSTPTYADRCLVLSANKKNCHHHVNGFGDISLISLVCNRAKSSKKTLFHALSNLGKTTLNLHRWELLA